MLTIVKTIRTNANDIFGNICVQMSTNEFAEWLQREIDNRNWNQSHLARLTGLTTAGISKLLSGGRSAGPEACRAIARALELSEVFVFQKAGLLSPQVDYDIIYEEWRAVLHELTADNRDELLQIARLRLERQRDEAWFLKFRELSPDQRKEVDQMIEQFMKRKGGERKE